MNIVSAAVVRLLAEGWPEPVLAWRRWRDPEPGSAVIVGTLSDDWTAGHTTAAYPALRVEVYAAPTEGQDDAEAIAVEVADRIRAVLHRPQGGLEFWGDVRILSSLHAGSGLAEPEGQPDWRVRSQVFEIETG